MRGDGRIEPDKVAVKGAPGGKVLTSDGYRATWDDAPAGVYISASAPSSPAVGQLWYDTDDVC